MVDHKEPKFESKLIFDHCAAGSEVPAKKGSIRVSCGFGMISFFGWDSHAGSRTVPGNSWFEESVSVSKVALNLEQQQVDVLVEHPSGTKFCCPEC